MVAEATVWVPVIGAVQGWLATATGLRVFRGFNDAAPLPQVRLTRIGGPDERALFQLDIVGDHGSDVEQVAADLCTTLDGLTRTRQGDVLLHGARIDDVRWAPDSTTDRPRMIVTAAIFATSA
jgi:hypothetical protein